MKHVPATARQRRLLLLVGVGLVLVSLLLVVCWRVSARSVGFAERELRARLLRQATETAASIDPAWARGLGFSSNDACSPHFVRISSVLKTRAQTLPLCGVYGLGLVQERVRVGPGRLAVGQAPDCGPGDEFPDPPQALRAAFNSRRAVVVGPVTSARGSFVTGVAPVLCPQNGRVRMLVALEVEAGAWQSLLNVPRSTPWLVSVFIAVAALMLWVAIRNRLRTQPQDTLRLASWIVMPMALAILVGLLFYGIRMIYEVNRTVCRDMQLHLEQVRGTWNQLMDARVTFMAQRAGEIASDAALRNAWAARDSVALARLAEPMRNDMRVECGCAIIGFWSPDGSVILREQRPTGRDDGDAHEALRAAELSGSDAWGVDRDQAGLTVLTYVKTVKEGDRTLGYLELGFPINRMTRLLSATTADVLASAVMHVVTPQASGDGREIAGGATGLAGLPPGARRWLAKREIRGGGAEVCNVRRGRSVLACGLLRVPAGRNGEMAELLVMRDVTTQFGLTWGAMLYHMGMAMGLLGGVLALVWIVSNRAERQIQGTFARLFLSEARYRAMFETMTDGMMVIAPDGRIVQANAAAARILRVERREVERRRYDSPEWKRFRPDGSTMPSTELAIHLALKEQRKVEGVVVGMRAQDGASFWVTSSAAPILDRGGRLEGVVATISDVSERKHAEDRMRLQRDLAIGMLDQHGLVAALEKMLELCCRIPGVDSGGVYRVDGKTGRADLLAHRGLSATFVAAIAHVEPDNFRARQLLEGRPIYWGGDVLPGPDVDGVLAQEGLRALAVIPQYVGGRVVAALNLASHTGADFSHDARLMIESMSALMGGAIAQLDAQDAIRRAQQNLELLVETMRDFLFIADESGRLLRTNRAAQEAFGYTAEEFAGLSVQNLYRADWREEAAAIFADMIAGRRTTCQVPMVGRQGQVVEAEIKGHIGWWDGHRVLIGLARDISERLRAERALLAKDAALAKAQQIAHLGSWELDDATHELRWSDETFRIFGYEPGAVAPSMALFMDRVHPDDRDALQTAITAAWNGHATMSQDHRIVLPSGEERVVHERAEFVNRTDDLPATWVGTVQDITAARRATAALRESDENFRNLAENTWYGIVVCRADELLVYGNRRAVELLGYTPEELLRIKTGDVVMPESYPELRSRLRHRLEGRPVALYETFLRRKDGSNFPAEIAGTRTLWRGEMCALFLFRDLTARKKMELEIVEISDWEKVRIGQDLHDILGQQLTGMAYLSQVLAGAWKTQSPLATDSTLKQLVNEARQGVILLRQVAQGLMPLARTPSGLVEALRDLCERTQRIYGVICVLQEDAAVTLTDPQAATHLFYIAQEAITNAVRHGQAGQIIIRLARSERQGELMIQDNGIGVSAKRQDYVGLGSHIMQYRAGLIGGTLTIGRGERGGTRVTCCFEQPTVAQPGAPARP